MREKDIKEGLADLAQRAESDHEVQMARADLYKIAKYSIKLHDMLKQVSEADGLEGWQQSKITKASDYISSVYHNLDYKMKFGEIKDDEVSITAEDTVEEGKSPHKKGTKKYKKHMAAMHAESSQDTYKQKLAAKLEEKKKGLYHNVNKRKAAGTSRSKNHPDAPSDQDWKDAAKTAKK